MRPPDRDLVDPVADVLRDHQGLEIEAETIEAATLEDVLRHISLEHLEAALRVVDASDAEELNHLVRRTPHRLTQLRLALFEGALAKGTASDGNIPALVPVIQEL